MAKLASSKPTDSEKELLVQIWSKAVDTQMHFNEMSVKSRQLGLTFVAAALGVAIFLLSRGEEFELPVFGFTVHAAVLIILAAAASVWVVRKLDLGVYHRMLRGAVTFGEDFEQQYMRDIFQLEKGMTQAISHFSRFDDAKVSIDGAGTRYKYQGCNKRSAEEKIKGFYVWTFWLLISAALVLLFITNFATIKPPVTVEPSAAVEPSVTVEPLVPVEPSQPVQRSAPPKQPISE